MKKFFLLSILLLIASCAKFEKPKILQPKPVEFANAEDVIVLQNPDNRVIVYCLKDGYQTTTKCAKAFEKQGFVRLKNIPYKVAKYDFLQTDTYPTRRWRDGEITPRW